LLAWLFRIYNNYLEAEAAKAGYVMAFTIGYLPQIEVINQWNNLVL
jgi:hypothetical protein